ncbi:PAS domain-containing sensor histidine kinase [Adhaeribacter aquaticus]|uniref:PAS domain-containing sensor histidine kinase n=1 Tax=Adhaeribacter aquaticus TaxID=299567 RepID=UPI0003FF058A|nr:PAS domain-containing protein [Adhaeribacter aquaticus]
MNNISPANPEPTISGEALSFIKIFEAQANLALVLSPDLLILAATNAYLQETYMVREEITGKYLFDIFPDNPAAETSFARNLNASLQKVLATGINDNIGIIQYDIPDPNNPGAFLERYWTTLNTPVFNDRNEIVCIIHETVNVTEREKAQQQLKESQEREQLAMAQAEQQRMRLERLFEQAPAALAILEGPDLVFKVINSSYQQLFPGRELMNLPLFEALPELKDSQVYNIIYNVYNTGETFEGKEVLIPVARFENQVPEDIYWNFIYQAVYDKEGKVNGILIFALDVTEFFLARRQVEQNAEALRLLNQELEKRVEERTKELKIAQAETNRQWQQLEYLIMYAPSAICILDGPELTFQLINPVYQQIFPGRDLLNKPLLEALPELQDTPIPGLLQHVYQTGEMYVAQDLPLMMARHEGEPLEEIYWSFTYLARRKSNGDINGVMVFAHEVTNQVNARKSIEANAKQLQLITDSLPVLIGYVDREEYYRFANRAYEGWFSIKLEDVIGKKVPEVLGGKAYQNVKKYMDQALAGERVNFESAMPYREDLKKFISATFVPDVQEGNVVGFYTLVTDVSDQVIARQEVEQSIQEIQDMAKELAQANEYLRMANDQLTHTNIDLDNFIYTASHDLKAPITNIEMLVEELLIELPGETLDVGVTAQIIRLIRDAIDRFKKTIFNLTEISKLQKGNATDATLVNVAEIVKDVQLDLKQHIAAADVQVNTSFDTHLLFSFSQKNLRSIIYNLISNAIKYRSPERKSLVQVRFYEEQEFLVLSVRDNGLGLSPNNLNKLFSMFRRFHDHVEGTGVGLYMVKRIVDNAGGKIEVESEPGKGSVFRVYFKKADYL